MPLMTAWQVLLEPQEDTSWIEHDSKPGKGQATQQDIILRPLSSRGHGPNAYGQPSFPATSSMPYSPPHAPTPGCDCKSVLPEASSTVSRPCFELQANRGPP